MSCVVSDEVQWEKGCVSGAVYWGDESLTNLLVKVRIFVSLAFQAQIVKVELEYMLVFATVIRTDLFLVSFFVFIGKQLLFTLLCVSVNI